MCETQGKRATVKVQSALIFCFCCIAAVASLPAAEKTEKQSMQLTSTAFAQGQPIPAAYTCTGKNISPGLKWSGVPDGAKSLVLIADDPDAPMGTWVHWVLYDLPPATKELAEDLQKSQYISGGGTQGLNDFKHLGYGGPCPPPGKPHRYFFKLYALDKMLELKPGATKKAVEQAMEKHVLAQGELMGTYKR
jgi:Raf kinase inhibitor-like YbhB/YbcL family protein